MLLHFLYHCVLQKYSSSLSKSRISIFNEHLALFVRRMTSIGKFCHLVKLTLELDLERSVAIGTPDNK